MPKQWTGDFVGRLHNAKVSSREFAKFIGYRHEYISMVLNGKRSPKNAEKRFNEALDKLIKERSA